VQAYVRGGGLIVGAFAGWQPSDNRTSFGTKYQKVGGFVSYGWGREVFNTSEVTLAYGRGMLQGRLDRDYLYLQSRIRLTERLFFYQSSEIDIHQIDKGTLKSTPSFTNSYVSVTFYPIPWLNISGGYDATRAVYLFETMKSISETLVDQSLKQGFRGSLAIRLPMNIVVNAGGTLRPSSGASPEAHTAGGGVRIADIGRTGISAGAQYTKIVSGYSDGQDMLADMSWWMSDRLSASFRLDQYTYTPVGESNMIRTVTGSVNIGYRFTRSLYVMAFADQVWDSIQDLKRVYLECGIHF
jgi:hypothetical protein